MKNVLLPYLVIHVLLFSLVLKAVTCPYTEKVISAPKEILEAKIILFKPAFLAKGKTLEFACLPILGTILNELVASDTIKYNGKELYEKKNQKIGELKARSKEFKLVQVLSLTKQGALSTIDSGPGPFKFLILSDETGEKYQIATSALNESDDGYFLKFSSSKGEKQLTWNYFN